VVVDVVDGQADVARDGLSEDEQQAAGDAVAQVERVIVQQRADQA
jgi:hypothetical protein